MANVEDILKSFKGDKYEMSGDAVFPFWNGRELETIIAFQDDVTYPTPRQLGRFEQLLNHPENIRPEVEQVLFDHYQKHIYLSVMESGRDDEELTPKLNSSEEIWDIIGDPYVRIHYIYEDEPDDEIRFRLSYYGCPWDEEHGFGIEMRNWKAVDFGGEIP